MPFDVQVKIVLKHVILLIYKQIILSSITIFMISENGSLSTF